MTDETDLPPLPGPDYLMPQGPGWPDIPAWSENTVRQIVAHATAPLQAEIEALRELCGMAYQLAGVHDAPEKWLDALSNAAAGRPFSTDGLLPYMPQPEAQHQAAMEFDGTDREVLREFIRICREHKPVGQWPGERVCKAIERAMDNEKPFRFIAEEDMAPEREPSMKEADRMLSGPRRAAQQQGGE